MSESNFREMCAELVDALENARRIIHHEDGTLHIDTAEPVLRRAYALLATPPPEPLRPIPVSERLPGAEVCVGRPTEGSDAGWCWCYAYESWSLSAVLFPMPHPDQPRVLLNRGTTHWLPSNALPLPEVTP